jgi:N-acetylneuraminate synthase
MTSILPALVIAEIGSVHDGSFGNALKLVEVAADAGADAVKFQTHIAEAETLVDAAAPSYFNTEPRFEYFRRTSFTLEQWRRIVEHCRGRNIEFMSSPFSEEAVDVLEELGVRRHKIPSGEVSNLPLLEKVASLGKPVLLSSGMSSWSELDRAVDIFQNRAIDLTMLQCTSEYPCPPERVGLNVMLEMKARYGVPVGLSDHTVTPYASLAAVTLGASTIERHLTFSRQMYGSDAKHSMEPAELAELIRGIRLIECMRSSDVDKDDVEPLREMKLIFEKSIVTVSAVPAGAVLTRDVLGLRKPGTGFGSERMDDVLGRVTARELPPGRVLVEEDFVPS